MDNKFGLASRYIIFGFCLAEPGDYVAREGEPVDGLYIILDGQVKICANSCLCWFYEYTYNLDGV